MENLKYIPFIDKRQHIITLKDIFSYYDVKKLTGTGNLRIKYGRKDKRDLVISIFNVYIAELFDVFAEGGYVFEFPDKNAPKMMFQQVPSHIVKKARAEGKLKMLDPLASNFKGIETIIKVPSRQAFFEYQVILSKNFQEKIYDRLNQGKNLVGGQLTNWATFMPAVYNTFTDIDQKALDEVILYGFRKMNHFLAKGLEMYFSNTNYGEFIYIGRQANKIKDNKLKHKILERQYVKKLRWHWQAQKLKAEYSYYSIDEETYQRHLAGEPITTVLKKIKEECLIAKPWYKYVMKTTAKSQSYTLTVTDYDSSNDELIFIKPQK